jgi:hypothetical protein
MKLKVNQIRYTKDGINSYFTQTLYKDSKGRFTKPIMIWDWYSIMSMLIGFFGLIATLLIGINIGMSLRP